MNMNRFFAAGLVALFGLSAACGGGGDGGATEEVATEEAVVEGEETASLTTPDWMIIDEASQTVTLDIVAGKDDSNNRWNFNGYSRGNGAIAVPLGYTVTINFRNDDPNIAHSIGVDARTGSFPATFQDLEPVFAGAIALPPPLCRRQRSPESPSRSASRLTRRASTP